MTPLSESRLPAYQRVTSLLRDRIAAGYYRTDEYLPAERSLAHELGVSRQTLQLALAELERTGHLAQEPRRGNRVLSPPKAAVRTGLAALLIYELSAGGAAAIFRGYQSDMQEAGYHVIVAETASRRDRAEAEARQLRALLERPVDGVLVYFEPSAENAALLRRLQERGTAIVQLDRSVPGLEADLVGVDNRAGAADVTQHLLDLGHRRVAFLGNHPEASTVAARREGYREALQGAGIEPGECWTASLQTGADGPAAYQATVERWLALPEPPTAVVAANDTQAARVVQALRASGVRVPEDVSVAGFDNQTLATLTDPALTTVAQPFLHLGQVGAQLLLDRIAGGRAAQPRHLILPTQLIIRQSTAAAPRTLTETHS